jgi:hypothetical protein
MELDVRSTEVTMSSIDVSNQTSTETLGATASEMKLEVVALPVSGVDRAKGFYQASAGGWMPTSPRVTTQARTQMVTPTIRGPRSAIRMATAGWLLREIKTRRPGR